MADARSYDELKARFDVLESKLAALDETLPDLIWVKDTNGVYLSCNKRFERFFGAKESQIIGKTDYDFVDKAQADFFREKDKQAMKKGCPVVNEEEIVYADDGHREILETIKTPMHDPDGNLIGVLGVARDITRRKHAEQQMQRIQNELEVRVKKRTEDLVLINKALKQEIAEKKQVEKKYETSEYQRAFHLKNTPVGVITLDLEYRILEWNPAAEGIFGYTLKQAYRKNLFELIIPDNVRNDVKKVFKDLLAGHGGTRNINDNITKDKKSIICDWYNTVLTDENGKATGFASMVNDITQLKAHEKLLRRFEAVIEQADEEVVITDASGIIQYVNPSFVKNTGYSKKEVVGRNPRILNSGMHDQFFYKKIWKTILSGRIWKGNIKNKCRDGRIMLHDMVISPILDSENQVSGFVSIRRDITQQKKLEMHIQQSRKMEAIGTLAGGIAHDFNNILSGIFGYAQLAEIHVEKPERAKNYITQITTGARRASELVQQILAFSRQSEHKKNELRLYLIVKEAVKFLRSSIPATIEIKEKFNAREKVLANPTQIHQIVMNLSTNAYHAMRENGGILTIELETKPSQALENTGTLDIRPGEYIRLKISDTGAGMEPEVLDKIFEPYFTTKEMGEGTGLGLAVVLGIVNDHNGYIHAESTLGKGSVFTVYFPVLRQESADTVVPDEQTMVKGGGETIMIVDDEKSILDSTRDLLDNYGYDVKAFLDSAAALHAFEQHPERYDLIITDMTMPGVTGEKLSVKAMKVKPEIPVILCTGYSDQISEDESQEIGIAKYLQKPVSSATLLDTIRQIMDK